MVIKTSKGTYIGGWPTKLGSRHPNPCQTCSGTGALMLMDNDFDKSFMILDRYLCPECEGACSQDGLKSSAIEFDISIKNSDYRGKAGEQEGNSFSGVIAKEPEKGVHFQQEFGVERLLQ